LCLVQGVVLLLDSRGPAVAFQRIWCNFEVSMATDQVNNLLLDIVAANSQGELHVLTDGMTSMEKKKEVASKECPWQESGRTAQAKREEKFPIEVMLEAFNVRVLDAKCSSEQDRCHILNIMADRPLDWDIDLKNQVYKDIDCRLRSRFAQQSLRSAIQHFPTIDISNSVNLPIARAIREDPSMTTLDVDLTSCWRMTDDVLRALSMAVPTTSGQLKRANLKFDLCYQLTNVSSIMTKLAGVEELQEISIDFTDCTGLQGSDDFAALGVLLSKCDNLSRLDMNFSGCNPKLDPCLAAMTKNLKSSQSIKEITVVSSEGENLALEEKIKPDAKAKPKPRAKKKRFVSETAKCWAR